MAIETQVVKTVCCVCGLCGCGLEVTAQNGKVMKVDGDKAHPESKGALCPKGRAAMEILYSPDRLKYPMKRVGKRGHGHGYYPSLLRHVHGTRNGQDLSWSGAAIRRVRGFKRQFSNRHDLSGFHHRVGSTQVCTLQHKKDIKSDAHTFGK